MMQAYRKGNSLEESMMRNSFVLNEVYLLRTQRLGIL
jgi:hypothetical protein